jgi:protein TonB
MKTKKITLDDIVFENRNKEYGAYFLRTHYEEHLLRAFLYATLAVFLLSAFLYFYFKTQSPTMGLPKVNKGVTIIIDDFLPKEPEKVKIPKKTMNLTQI